MSNCHLLVDARNALYRAVYAKLADRRNKDPYHCFTIFLRQLAAWTRKYEPRSVHIFWDTPRKTVWRRVVDSDYKNRDNNHYVEALGPELAKGTAAGTALLEHMNVRQYSVDGMEADDLIYAACTVLHPAKTVVVSTDSDLTQIPYLFDSVAVYNPKDQVEVPKPDVNPAAQKALAGELSDNISGYKGIGPVKSKALLESYEKLQEFLVDNGSEVFARNLLLTDLSLCPRLLQNQLYVRRVLAKPTRFDKQKIFELAQEHKVHGLMTEYADLTYGLRNLI